MRQIILDKAVARATGESLEVVRHRGFSSAHPLISDDDTEPELSPQFIDWDQLDLERPSLFP